MQPAAAAPPPQAASLTSAAEEVSERAEAAGAGAAVAAAAAAMKAAEAEAAAAAASPTHAAPAAAASPVTTAASNCLPQSLAAAAAPRHEYQLQPEPANKEELEDMIAVLIQRLFVAAKSAYALDLLQQRQQQQKSKLHCLARLSAAELDSILAQRQPLELLDAVYEQHSQKLGDEQKQKECQETLLDSEPLDYPGADVQESENTSDLLQKSSPTDPWQQPQTSAWESMHGRAKEYGVETTTSGAEVEPEEQEQNVGELEDWSTEQQEQQQQLTNLPQLQSTESQQQISVIPQQSQLLGQDLTFGTFDRCDSATDSDWLSVTSSDSAEFPVASDTLPTVEQRRQGASPYAQHTPQHTGNNAYQTTIASEAINYMFQISCQQATQHVELVPPRCELSEQYKATLVQVLAADDDTSGGNGMGAKEDDKADGGSDDNDIADMLTMLAC